MDCGWSFDGFRLFFLNQRKQARSAPANATLTIETVRPDGERQNFAFRTKDEYIAELDGVTSSGEITVSVEHERTNAVSSVVSCR